jgi:hypothetical protein
MPQVCNQECSLIPLAELDGTAIGLPILRVLTISVCPMQANIGNYETSARFYIRALGMNPRASSTWGYLRTSLACSGRMDLMELVHDSNLDALSKELPL